MCGDCLELLTRSIISFTCFLNKSCKIKMNTMSRISNAKSLCRFNSFMNIHSHVCGLTETRDEKKKKKKKGNKCQQQEQQRRELNTVRENQRKRNRMQIAHISNRGCLSEYNQLISVVFEQLSIEKSSYDSRMEPKKSTFELRVRVMS